MVAARCSTATSRRYSSNSLGRAPRAIFAPGVDSFPWAVRNHRAGSGEHDRYSMRKTSLIVALAAGLARAVGAPGLASAQQPEPPPAPAEPKAPEAAPAPPPALFVF